MSDNFNLDIDITEALEVLNDLPKEVNRGVNKEIKTTAFKVMATAVKSISANQSQGNVYTRGGVKHIASKEGEAPNTDTGNLVQSINVRKLNSLTGLDSYEIGSALDYAAWLEFGTLKTAARPWLMPAMGKVEPDHINRITKAVQEAIKDAEQ